VHDGGERRSSKTLIYQCLPSRYGFKPTTCGARCHRSRDRQGAKPAAAACCWARRSIREWRKCACFPRSRSALGLPASGLDGTGRPDIKIQELREITDWEKPIYVKVVRPVHFTTSSLAVHAGADVIVVDGMQGGTAATQTVFIENVGIPTLAALRQAGGCAGRPEHERQGATRLWRHFAPGGCRKALAMGADAVSIGQGYCSPSAATATPMCKTARIIQPSATTKNWGPRPDSAIMPHRTCPVGVTTQDAVLEQRLQPASVPGVCATISRR